MTFRALVSETLDPDGALCRWLSPDVRRLGWRVFRLPTQEAIHLLGPAAYAKAAVRAVQELRPHVLLVHPPYDHLPVAECAEIRAAGTRIVGLGFDDPLFAAGWDDAAFADFHARFDRWATTSLEGPTVAAGARPVRWALSPEAVVADDPDAPSHEVVMVGRRLPPRDRVVAALEAAGLEVGAYGAGWPRGPVTRARMLGLMRRASVVVTPNDGTAMIKARLLEAAFVGARQIVEYSPDLAAHFPDPAHRPQTWSTPEQCVTAAQSKPRAIPAEALSTLRWTARWPELLDGLTFEDQPERTGSPALATLLAAIAHVAEPQGRLAAAEAAYGCWAEHDSARAGALAGLTRCAHADGRYGEAAEHAAQALAQARVAPATASLSAWVPSHGQGAGLGRSGGLDPTVELEALRLHSLLQLGRGEEATALARALPSPRRAVVASLLAPEPGNEAFWAAMAGPV